ncbi:hypothetical protein ABH521_007695 [Staphylococcus warneri]
MTSQQDQQDEKVIAEDEKQTKYSFCADVFSCLHEIVGGIIRLICSLFLCVYLTLVILMMLNWRDSF